MSDRKLSDRKAAFGGAWACVMLLIGASLVWREVSDHSDWLWPLLKCALGGFIFRGAGDRLFRKPGGW